MITIVIGKPGSGKSYDTVRNLLATIENDVNRGKIRRIYTNLSLNVSAIESYIEKKTRKRVDLKSKIRILNEDFFVFRDDLVRDDDYVKQGSGKTSKVRISDNCLGYWWNRFEDDSLIIIDEIQKYLHSATKEGVSATLAISMYFSTHRHHRHEIILITQALTSLSTEVRKYAEQVKEIFNSKSMTIPFPFNINGRDLDILRAGLGITNQVYRVKTGTLLPGNSYRPIYEGDTEVVKTSSEVYACYKTHTKQDTAKATDFDLPFKEDKYVKFRAIAWFIRKNAFNFGWKIAAIVFILLFVRGFIYDFCPAFADNFFNMPVEISVAPDGDDEMKDDLPSEIVSVDNIVPELYEEDFLDDIELERDLDADRIFCYSPDAVMTSRGEYVKLNEVFPDGKRLKEIDVLKGEIKTNDGEQDYLADLYFLYRFCARLRSEAFQD